MFWKFIIPIFFRELFSLEKWNILSEFQVDSPLPEAFLYSPVPVVMVILRNCRTTILRRVSLRDSCMYGSIPHLD